MRRLNRSLKFVLLLSMAGLALTVVSDGDGAAQTSARQASARRSQQQQRSAMLDDMRPNEARRGARQRVRPQRQRPSAMPEEPPPFIKSEPVPSAMLEDLQPTTRKPVKTYDKSEKPRPAPLPDEPKP